MKESWALKIQGSFDQNAEVGREKSKYFPAKLPQLRFWLSVEPNYNATCPRSRFRFLSFELLGFETFKQLLGIKLSACFQPPVSRELSLTYHLPLFRELEANFRTAESFWRHTLQREASKYWKQNRWKKYNRIHYWRNYLCRGKNIGEISISKLSRYLHYEIWRSV